MKCVCASLYFFVHNICFWGVKYEATVFLTGFTRSVRFLRNIRFTDSEEFVVSGWSELLIRSRSRCDDVHDVFLRQGQDGDMIESQHPLGLRSCDTNVRLVLMGDCVCVCVRRLCGEQIFVRMYWIRLIVLCCNRGKTDPGAAGGFCWGSWRSLCPGRGGRRGRWRPLHETTSADTSGEHQHNTVTDTLIYNKVSAFKFSVITKFS